MTPRRQNLMRALSTGKPITAKELRRDLGWSLDAVQRAINRLHRDGHTETVVVDGVAHFTTRKPCAGTTVARAIKAAPALHSVWN